MKKIFQDPLFHFVGLGFLLFVLFSVVGPAGNPEQDDYIGVDRETLLTFIQYRSRNFDREVAIARLSSLDQASVDQLVDEYVREEVLYREGLSLGLDNDDYVIRRRLIQKVEFLAEGFASASARLSEEELTTYFQENKQDYFVLPSITFTHVFFDKAKHGDAAADLAAAALVQLNDNEVPFSGAPAHGDRFPFHLNYVERTPAFVASHFGREMADAVMALPVSDTEWQGVFTSAYGAHLVMVSARTEGRDPTLDEVRARVREDAMRERMASEMDIAVAKIAERYDIDIDLTDEARP
jgi:parvulin-like peptidyl-prolyl cis-trans isomerase-like protein